MSPFLVEWNDLWGRCPTALPTAHKATTAAIDSLANACVGLSQQELLPLIADSYLSFRILEMDQWDEDFLNFVTQAYMQINPDGSGRFRFGVVDGSMDCHWTERDGRLALEFSWEAFDECDPVSGRGWAVLDGDTLKGHLYFHMGDDSGFVAKRAKRKR